MIAETNKLKLAFQNENGILAPGIYDPLSAKLAELNGFKAAWVSGFCVSTSLFVPDENYLTIDQYLHRVSQIRKISDIPLIVDCDEGYGHIDNTFRLLEGLYEMGVEACCIEDNTFPKINSFKDTLNRKDRIQDIDLFSEKMNLIKERFPHLALIARTESLIVGEEMAQAMKRANSYKSAGADLIMIHSRSKTLKEFEVIANTWGTPESLVVVPTLARNLYLKDLIKIGFRLIILANQVLRSSINIMNNVYEKMNQDSEINSLNDNTVSMDFIFNLIDSHYNVKSHV